MGFVRCVVATGALLSLASVWSGCGASDRLFAEYVLPEAAQPESVDCYEECELSSVKSGREQCFARCAGVVERFTEAPCKEPLTGRCTFDRLSPADERAAHETENASWVAQFLGTRFVKTRPDAAFGPASWTRVRCERRARGGGVRESAPRRDSSCGPRRPHMPCRPHRSDLAV